MAKNPILNFNLCCYLVTFTDPEGQIAQRNFNAIVAFEDARVNQLALDRIYRKGYETFAEAFKDHPERTKFVIQDVHLDNLIPLGRMTQDEFTREWRAEQESKQKDRAELIAAMEKAQAAEAAKAETQDPEAVKVAISPASGEAPKKH